MIVLPWPPSRNHTHVTTRQGRRVPTKVYRDYMEAARAALIISGCQLHESLAEITFRLYWPNRRRADADNRLKICRDALNGILVADDCWQCLPVEHVFNELDKSHPRIEVSWEA